MTRRTYEESIFRSTCVGAVVGAVLFGVGTTAMAMAVGASFGASLLLGGFTAIWGGGGFGGMFGAIAAARRHELEGETEAESTTPLPVEDHRHDLAA